MRALIDRVRRDWAVIALVLVLAALYFLGVYDWIADSIWT